MTDKHINILLIEDNPGDIRLIREFLYEDRRIDYTVMTAESLSEGLKILFAEDVDIVLLDLSLPDSSGLSALRNIRLVSNQTAVIVLTGFDDEDLAVGAVEKGAQDYLVKGQIGPALLSRSIQYALARHRAEEELRASEERYRLVVEDMPEMVCRFLPSGTLTFVNGYFSQYFGIGPDTLSDHNIFDLFPDEAFEDALQMHAPLSPDSPILTHERRRSMPDGTVLWLEWTDRALFDSQGKIVEYQSIGRDVTESRLALEERTLLEKKLQQAQRMESIGTLAGGIAHDFNNILFPIIGYTEMTLGEVTDPFLTNNLKNVLKSAERARKLIQQILTFSRHDEQELKPLRVQPIVTEALKLLRSSIPTTIRFQTDIREDCRPVMGDPTNIHQIIINLCTNAYHAMQETGGVLEVRVSEVMIETDDVIGNSDITPGAYLRLTVSDTGHGMDKAVMGRVFDPYFTTKEPGKGTGLGLSVVHGIVKSHGGGIEVKTTPGKGTAFHVYLPLIEEAVPEVREPSVVSAIPRGNERILLLDDEEKIVDMIREMLERLGYKVTAKTASVDTLVLFRESPDDFDLVITDMSMPNIRGDQLAQKMIEIRPDIPIILCSGFSEVINRQKALSMGIREYILKPVVMKEMAVAIRKVLDGQN